MSVGFRDGPSNNVISKVRICLLLEIQVIGSQWSPPEEGYVKFNTDGVVFSSRACASVGGVIRDVNGLWQCGFSMSIVEGTVFQKLELECDTALLIEIILVGGAANSKLTELQLIHHMLI
ncbi:hypothetical protein Goshw_002851 [Gossypium schwendimanii]|uniref:RNase H type-1 domain-containing protein n=1 Tax=Gossypium schwendimanii TaxID=34291 RepID=A0A7J9MFL0_GOSSC|nr:hypothetical protein [Gossypium schwendimanii]